jgi:hypothetical protein
MKRLIPLEYISKPLVGMKHVKDESQVKQTSGSKYFFPEESSSTKKAVLFRLKSNMATPYPSNGSTGKTNSLKNTTNSALYASAAPVGKDYLSCLPTELLLKIVGYLPIRCLLDLAHTSTSFKHFLQTNPVRICSNAI